MTSRKRAWLLCSFFAVAACASDDDFAYGPTSNAGSNGVGAPVVPPPSNAGDRYSAPGTNPFVLTSHDPLSTFGADVDTASYDIFRRDVNRGVLPQPTSVRLEEYVNAFPYDYPAPAANAEHPFQISLAAAAQALDRPTILLRVGVQATKPPPQDKRPANIVFLVDVSGSMQSSDKLPLVQQVLRQTLDLLAPTDKVSIVTYAAGTRVRLPATAVAQRASITRVIDALGAGGSTAGAAGLELAYAQAADGFIEGGINHVVLCTDGDFNVGPSTTRDLLALIRSKRNMGITLTTLGFGVGNLNDGMMEAVSDAGDGVYGVISDEEQAARYVHERMLSTIVRVAKDLKLQVEFNPDRVAAYRLLGYEDRAIADRDFRNDVVDAGEVGAGHRVTALYELVLAGQTVPAAAGAPALVDGAPSITAPREVAAADLVLVKVRYKGIDATDATPAAEVSVALPSDEVSEGLLAADPDLQWAAAIAAYAEILKGSPYADRALMPDIDRIVTAQGQRDADRAEFAQLFAKAKALR